MWEERTQRQVLELLHSYREVNSVNTESNNNKDYEVKSEGVKVPKWLKVPKGAKVYDIDDINSMRDIM